VGSFRYGLFWGPLSIAPTQGGPSSCLLETGQPDGQARALAFLQFKPFAAVSSPTLVTLSGPLDPFGAVRLRDAVVSTLVLSSNTAHWTTRPIWRRATPRRRSLDFGPLIEHRSLDPSSPLAQSDSVHDAVSLDFGPSI
jgi:hypothetical protein